MREILFARWGDAVVDNRPHGALTAEPRPDTLPPTWAFPEDLIAVMCGKGLLVLDDQFDYVTMMREYVGRIQEKYCCGRCLTGIKGTKMLLLALERICDGQGSIEDLFLSERVSKILVESTRCSVCASAGELMRDGLAYFRDQFVDALTGGTSNPNFSYVARLSAPCMSACPCHINVPGYVEKIQETRYEESLAIIRQEMPLPGITGRVCPAPCQKACTLANLNQDSIPIKVLKRVSADYEMSHDLAPPITKTDLDQPPVAVVGSGPAGLSAAYYLVGMGHPVTIYEALPVSGGMVGVGIPPYRQPKDVLEREVGIIMNLGAELKQGVTLGKDTTIDGLFGDGFKAVLLAVGSHRSVDLGIKGQTDGVKGIFSSGIDFLRNLNLGKRVHVGDKVVVVGGGNTAIDCARTCLRIGAREVHIVYRRSEKEMPADPEEVEDSVDEGILFHYLTQPVEIISQGGRMVGIKCVQMELGEQDYTGRRRPAPVPGSEFEMAADSLVPAIGQKSALEFIKPEDNIEITRWGTVKVDEHTMMTSKPGVFAAGDAVSGPLTVVHGVAGGKLAARMIHDYVTTGRCEPSPEQIVDSIVAAIEKDPSVPVTSRRPTRGDQSSLPKKLDRRKRVSTFAEVESGYTQSTAFVESSRCLRCFHLALAAMR